MKIGKKKYIAPVISVEHYELTQTIATCNAIKIGMNGTRSCVLSDGDATNEMKSLADSMGYFVSTASDCSYKVSAGDETSDGICYHTNISIAFNS